ncbi:MAG: aminotransferase class III-fold pyridoxal phosphate-dependent enzyme, partial [Alphaproteobacteria bacterium]|nr:aminotransferase class III-fold pyridoxal phosphate-dependent enzyme [Alphaproteobacteria bacterium]
MTVSPPPSDDDAAAPSFGGAAIAIVGMAGRFPGAPGIRQLWKNLRDGVESVSRFAPHELEDSFPDEIRNSPDFVAARSVLDGVEMFDAEFFGMHAREAALTDPQHRILLECCWEALEDAGHDPAAYTGAIGVFTGTAYNSYLLKHVMTDRAAVDELTSNFQVGSYAEISGALPDFAATRVAYKLDLKGPALNLQSACSTSLSAVVQACQSLLLYQSDMALAGGVSITFPQKRGYLSLEGGMVSRDGHCRPFDAKAAGTVFGGGAGIVLLKRLDDAIADGDHIYAVIRGFGINNDGSQKIGFTAPSVDGQAGAIASALAMAEVDAGSIGYVECHGTATPLGDPIEFNGLVKAFRATTDARNYCVLGSAKANFGHLDAAAGVTGLIKAALVLHQGEIPPLVNFASPNPHIDLASSPFKFAKDLTPWPQDDAPRRAGVSSFGVGGTNVHVVLEEAPRTTTPARDVSAATAPVILPLSARTPDSLDRMAQALAERLESIPALDVDDVARTLQSGRRAFDCRTAIVATDRADAIAKLKYIKLASVRPTTQAPKIVFMFPGQAAQYPGMGRALYDSEPVFRAHVDRGARLLEPIIGADIRALLYDQVSGDDDAPHPIRSTVLAQPALFLIEYATAQLLLDRGIEPTAMVGHSLGEFVAASLAGVFSFEDALKLVAARGRLMQSQPPGAMLGVRLSQARLSELCGDGVEIAAVNAPSLSVAAGTFEAVSALEAKLDAQSVSHRRLHTSHAFHSAMMDDVVEALKAEAARIKFSAPKRPYVSAVDGNWARAEDVMSPDYWARHCRQRVRFADAIATVLEGKDTVLVEVGPGRTLSTFALQAKDKSNLRSMISTLPEFANRETDRETFSSTLANLWCEGVPLDWTKLQRPGSKRVSLPTYAFARKRHWVDAPKTDRNAVAPAATAVVLATQLTPPAIEVPPAIQSPQPSEPEMSDPRIQLDAQIRALLEDLSGESLDGASATASFVELGFDSLFLGQVVQRLQKTFGVKITFRQLMKDYPTIEALVDLVLKSAKPGTISAPPQSALAVAAAVPHSPVPTTTQTVPQFAPGSGIEGVLQQQLVAMQQLIAQQLQTIQTIAGVQQANAPQPMTPAQAPQRVTTSSPVTPPTDTEEEAPAPSRFQMYRPGATSAIDEMSPDRRRFIDDLVRRYTEKSPGSKARTQEYRAVLADPRSANGFRAEWKEMVYPLVVERSKGSKLLDVDGNEYIDLVNGFGQTMFGHAPDFVTDAVEKQLAEGFAIGPQTPLAGEVAKLFADMTGNERVTFCNTGSEAVMAAMRIARTVTGREKIVVFGGSYHGQFDEVLVKPAPGKGKRGASPVAPGIPQESVDNIIVLPYATPESLAWVRENADDLAAVMAETVQSRHPSLRPQEFLSELRAITEASGSALIFDEVVTGFRVAQGGMQAVFGIKADLATYGKVVGGGMPVGVLAGKAKFMDALDGGFWRFGDDSAPEVAPTFFAGTFVRHPLVMAACRAVLLHMKEHGPELQEALAERMRRLVAELNGELARCGVKTRFESYSSWAVVNFAAEDALGSLLFQHMRLLGIHVLEGFPWFLTTAHSDSDTARIARAFKESLEALQSAGILAPSGASASSNTAARSSLDEKIPLTEAQTEIWLAAQLGDEASCAFNESGTLTLKGELRPDVLISALNDVVARHEALRMTVSASGDALQVKPTLELAIPLIDISHDPDAHQRQKQLMDSDAQLPFDLANGPLCRGTLVKRSALEHGLIFTAHHIICDGWSMGIVMAELAACYAARLEGHAVDLPPPMGFRRYAREQGQRKQIDPKVEKFWLNEFKDLPAPLELPADRQRPPLKSFRGATHSE